MILNSVSPEISEGYEMLIVVSNRTAKQTT
jgi:hypothetical protein